MRRGYSGWISAPNWKGCKFSVPHLLRRDISVHKRFRLHSPQSCICRSRRLRRSHHYTLRKKLLFPAVRCHFAVSEELKCCTARYKIPLSFHPWLCLQKISFGYGNHRYGPPGICLPWFLTLHLSW